MDVLKPESRKDFDLEAYMAHGVENIVKDIVKTSLFHPKESVFMAKFALASKKASERRRRMSENGTHVPPFLIASITSVCNLHCAGCYARHLSTCEDGDPVEQLTGEDWGRLFREANDLGISFILLAGGEPLVRRDVMMQAASIPEILFPVFTNGTMLNDEYIRLVDTYRNLIPIISIEGGPEQTNARRGDGVYRKITDAMDKMNENRIVYGASVTVTNENLKEVTSDEFVSDLAGRGCKAVIYVEYVPVSEYTEYLAPGDAEREYLAARVSELRGGKGGMLFLSFPGDENKSNGCLAAGRGFFHINSHGGAEPCPFSPYSDINVKQTSLLDALNSKLFAALRDGDLLVEDHNGGCVLFERREQVEALLENS